METLLICLLLFYNAWLVSYILLGRRQKDAPAAAERPPAKPPRRDEGIVGKSLFKMDVKTPQATIPEPQAAKPDEGEDVTDIDVTFADEMPSKREQNGNSFSTMPSAAGIMQKDETPAARLPDDKLDEAFTDIRITDVPVEYAEDEEEKRTTGKQYATGASFEEIGEAVKIADNPAATAEERKRAGQVFSEMEGNELFNKMIGSNAQRAKRITGLMDEISGKTISGEGKAIGNVVYPRNKTGVEMPADISGFDIRDFV